MLQRLSLVLLFAIAAVVAAALALGAYLNYGSVRAAYFAQIDSRFLAMAKGIVDDIETSISFGIPLVGQETLGPLLTREQAADPVLLAIDVVAADGEILFSSASARVGQTLSILESEGLRLEQPIVNAFGSEDGSVRLIADLDTLDRNLDATASTVLLAAIYALAGALLLAMLAVVTLLAGARRHVQQVGRMAKGEEDLGQGWALAEVDKELEGIAKRLRMRGQ